jgi:hypothetical protein
MAAGLGTGVYCSNVGNMDFNIASLQYYSDDIACDG